MTATPSDVPSLIKTGQALRRAAEAAGLGYSESNNLSEFGMLAEFGAAQMTALSSAATTLSSAVTALNTPVNTTATTALGYLSAYGANVLPPSPNSATVLADIATAAALASAVLDAAVALLGPALELAAMLGVKVDPNLAPFDGSRLALRGFLRSTGALSAQTL